VVEEVTAKSPPGAAATVLLALVVNQFERVNPLRVAVLARGNLKVPVVTSAGGRVAVSGELYETVL
jgi:hypothetical protein